MTLTRQQKIRRTSRRRDERVFPHLVDTAALVDTIWLSVDSDQNPRVDDIFSWDNSAFLPAHSQFSRMITTSCTVTGNPVTILYGKAKRFAGVPSFALLVQSDLIPMTAAQINKLVESLFPNASMVRVRSVGLTFDVSSLSFSEVYDSAVSRAHHTRKWSDRRGRSAFYIGSPRSFWSACIYERQEAVLRLEFWLRRGFLSSHGLNCPNDLVALRRLKLSKLISLRRFFYARTVEATKSWPEVARECCLRSGVRPLWFLNHILRVNGLNPNHLLPQTRGQRQLESMLSQLLW